METNPIFMTGYALYLNTYPTTKNMVVEKIFYMNGSNIVYGMYVKKDDVERIRFCFEIDEERG